ncbi:hypothetical protein OHA74_54310 [Streptomyces phaeochromogenes]|uniref:hypothetical protein n=1 Tax=Streptomyces phaeochromogenes TaxID=1923 RepID=UPI002E2AAA3E|nr:hypothetical protein [Streptomyces phaeochromogenes]
MIEDRGPDGRSPLYQGTGSQTIRLKSHPTGQAIVECTRLSPASRRIPKLTLNAGDDTKLELAGTIVKGPGDTHCRFLIGDFGTATTRIQVECAADCAWQLRVLPLSAARVLHTWATGTGSEVLVYDGPPAVLKLRQTKGRGTHVSVYVIRANRLQAIMSTGAPTLVSGDIIGLSAKALSLPLSSATMPPELSPKPTTLNVASYGADWELSVSAPEKLRSFAQEINGRGSEVVRYTGPPRTVRITNRSWWPGHDLGVSIFAEDLSHRVDLLAPRVRGGPSARFQSRSQDLRSGALLDIRTAYSSRWRIRTDT